MALNFICPHCSVRLAVNNDKLPKQVICPKCRQSFRPVSTDGRADSTGTPEAPQSPGMKNAPPEPAPACANVGSPSNSSGAGISAPVANAPKPSSPPPNAPQTWKPGDSMADLMRAVIQAFHGQVVHRRLLLAVPAGCGFRRCRIVRLDTGLHRERYRSGVWPLLYGRYALPTVESLRESGSAALYVMLFHAGVVVGGLAVLYSLLAPLFCWRREKLNANSCPPVHSRYCIASCAR